MRTGTAFGLVLGEMIRLSGVQKQTLAQTLCYDVSYISKWLSGRMLPSPKNASSVIAGTADLLVDTADEENLYVMRREYGCADDAALKSLLRQTLTEAYQSDRWETQAGPGTPPAVTPAMSDLQVIRLQEAAFRRALDVPAGRSPGGTVSGTAGSPAGSSMSAAGMSASGMPAEGMSAAGPGIMLLADVSLLEHESRLRAAGIKNGRFLWQESRTAISCSMGVCLEQLMGSYGAQNAYNAIYLIHLLTAYSGFSFQLYNVRAAAGKFILVAGEEYSLTAMPVQGDQMLAVCEFHDPADVSPIAAGIRPVLSQENLMFRRTTMRDLIAGQEYGRAVTSSGIRWLLGHVTEHLLPETLWHEIREGQAKQTGQAEQTEQTERTGQTEQTDSAGDSSFLPSGALSNLQRLTACALLQEDTHILLYESALSDLVSTGEVDFYNQPIFLNAAQRVQVLSHLYELAGRKGLRLRIVQGGFSDDFRHITNPCMLLSDAGCMLRLENHRYQDNLLVLQERQTRTMFEQFYETVWSERGDVVLGEGEETLSCIRRLLHSAKVLLET